MIEIGATYLFAGWADGENGGRKARVLKAGMMRTYRVEFPNGETTIVPARLLEGPVAPAEPGEEPCRVCGDSGEVKAWADILGEPWRQIEDGMKPCPRGCPPAIAPRNDEAPAAR